MSVPFLSFKALLLDTTLVVVGRGDVVAMRTADGGEAQQAGLLGDDNAQEGVVTAGLQASTIDRRARVRKASIAALSGCSGNALTA